MKFSNYRYSGTESKRAEIYTIYLNIRQNSLIIEDGIKTIKCLKEKYWFITGYDLII